MRGEMLLQVRGYLKVESVTAKGRIYLCCAAVQVLDVLVRACAAVCSTGWGGLSCWHVRCRDCIVC
jgi:hypothetical protein